jgi:DNA polymerase-3 subunit alpha
LGRRYDARFVATNDVHYVDAPDARLQDILLAIQTGSLLADDKRFRMTDESYYLRSPQEMSTLFSEVPEALSNTLLVAERCNIDLKPKGYHLPDFEVPEGDTPQTYLRRLCEAGLQQRYGDLVNDPTVRQRLEYELQVIHEMGFDAYFLIVWDLFLYARQEGVWYNARGSAAGSMVAYTLDITLVEPIDHGLIFERFLNPGRISMPDIDLDFQDDKRARIMEYCANKYGNDKVAQIITFGTLGARAAIRDVGRVMDIPISEVDRVAKLIPNIPGKPLSISEALQEVPELKTIYQETDYLKTLIDTASQMEGVVRNAGTHAAGVVISDRPVLDYVPLHRPTSGAEDSPIKTVTQFEMSILDSLGLLKVDFLWLATLTIMARACELIRQRHGNDLDLHNIPTDDPLTYEFIGQGHTAGVFQLEGTGMTRYITQMKPQSLANVIAMVALYRPGPMEFIPQYIRRMHGEEKVTYRHPAMEPIFKETYGIPIYQEQIMFAAMELAGYTASEADELRKAISKKKADAIAQHRQRFVQGAVSRSIPHETASQIFEDWENFARYGFNKSHAADYGVIAVKTAYLKAHYTIEYMTAVLSASKNDTDKVAFYVADARGMGLSVLPPDINASGWDFTIEDRPEEPPAIRFGLGAVKNVGQGAVELIIKGRQEAGRAGGFGSLSEFARTVDLRQVGKRPLECLVRVGALDGFGPRLVLLEALDRIVNTSASHFRAVESRQMSFFDSVGGSVDEITLPAAASQAVDRREMLNWERDLIGLYVSAHPLTPYLPALKSRITHLSGQLGEAGKREKVSTAGMVTRFRTHHTKDGKLMGFVSMEDVQGNIELVVFPRAWDQYAHLIQVDKVLLVEGKVDAESGDPKLLVDRITPVDNPPEPVAVYDAGGRAAQPVPPAEPQPEATPEPERRTAPEKPAAAPHAIPAGVEEDPFGDMPAPPPAPDDWDLLPPPMDAPETDEWPLIPEMPAPSPASARPRNRSDQGREPLREPLHGPLAEAEHAGTAAPAASSNPPAPSPERALAPGLAPYADERTAEGYAVSKPDDSMVLQPFIVSPATVRNQSQVGDEPHMVTITLRSTGDREKDVRRLRCIHGALRSCPGRDRFAFLVFETGKRYLLEFPNETTGVGPELVGKLIKFAGEENIRIDPLKIQ